MSEAQTNKAESQVPASLAMLRVKPEWARFQVIPLTDAAFTRQRQIKVDTWTGETWERTEGAWIAIESLDLRPTPAKQV